MNAEADFIQAERILRIESPLGADVLLAQKLHMREAVSELFEAQMIVRSKNIDLVPQDLLGKSVDFSIELGGEERRDWNAIVTDLRAGPRHTRGLREYTLTLRPEVWLLSQTSDCRIWLDKSALDIADDLLGEHGIAAAVTSGVIEPVPPQHYSVQWNETDLDYLIRRLREDGLYFWWTHTAGAHQMHIASHAAGYIGGEDVRFAHGSTDRNHITRFETTFRYIPGKHAGRDWNFTTPGMVPGGETPSFVSLPKNGNYERYTYPMQGGYGPGSRASDGIEDANVERVSKLRMQAFEAEHATIEGDSTVRTLAAGGRFTPYDVANPDNVFDPHVILRIEHEAVDTSYESVENQPEYTNRFVAIPADVPATPHGPTHAPRIDGTQVAIVAGPPGEEIHPDEYGRIKLWFPWDRRATKDGTDTCWVRVSQNWAGTGWGGQIIPRIGMEVMVSYLDGDPDRPVVTGVVPNERQKVPYDLPANKTRSVFKTDTHKGVGYNELRFEDRKFHEELFLRAQKDRNEKVKNDYVRVVDRDEAQITGGDRLEKVRGDRRTLISGGYSIGVRSTAMGLELSREASKTHDGLNRLINAARNVLGNVKQGAMSVFVENMFRVFVGGNSTEEVARSKTVTVGADYHVSVEKGTQIDTGQRFGIDGRTISLTAEDTVHIQAGKSKIMLRKDGLISISGVQISVSSSSSTQIATKGDTRLSSENITQIAGSTVDIN